MILCSCVILLFECLHILRTCFKLSGYTNFKFAMSAITASAGAGRAENKVKRVATMSVVGKSNALSKDASACEIIFVVLVPRAGFLQCSAFFGLFLYKFSVFATLLFSFGYRL